MRTTLVPEDSFSPGLDFSFSRASKLHMLSFQLLIDHSQLRAKVGRNRLAEGDWSFPVLAPLDNGLAFEFDLCYWAERSSEASAVEEWYCWRWLTEHRFAQWRETFAAEKLNVRLGTLVWQLLLKTLCRPLFACHLSRKEHVWMLLHGAHAARGDAGISQPAFAQLWEGTLRIRPAIL